jgi:hypothetical protein
MLTRRGFLGAVVAFVVARSRRQWTNTQVASFREQWRAKYGPLQSVDLDGVTFSAVEVDKQAAALNACVGRPAIRWSEGSATYTIPLPLFDMARDTWRAGS